MNLKKGKFYRILGTVWNQFFHQVDLQATIFQFRSSWLSFMSKQVPLLSLIARHQSGCTIFYKVKVTLRSSPHSPRLVFFIQRSLLKVSSRADQIIGDTARAEETCERDKHPRNIGTRREIID